MDLVSPRLSVIDISTPSLPSVLGVLGGLGCGFGLDVVGDRAYYGGCADGLHVIDVSDPTTPTLLGTAAAFDESRGVKVRAGTAYVAGYQGGMRVIDVTDPNTPTEIGFYVTTYAAEVDLVGDWALMALYDGSLVSFDISGCPDGGLFADGFESGDLSAWSSTSH